MHTQWGTQGHNPISFYFYHGRNEYAILLHFSSNNLFWNSSNLQKKKTRLVSTHTIYLNFAIANISSHLHALSHCVCCAFVHILTYICTHTFCNYTCVFICVIYTHTYIHTYVYMYVAEYLGVRCTFIILFLRLVLTNWNE